MKDYSCFVETLHAASGVEFRPASADELCALKRLGMPPAVVDFYAKCAPADTVERKIRLWSIGDVLAENTELMPGCNTSKYGYFVFASTFSGDAYCFDTTTCDPEGNPRIVLISHETVWEETTAREIAECASVVAPNLSEFLRILTEDGN